MTHLNQEDDVIVISGDEDEEDGKWQHSSKITWASKIILSSTPRLLLSPKPRKRVHDTRDTFELETTKTMVQSTSNALAMRNNMVNLEKNIIFGPYWHVLAPCLDVEGTSGQFTQYDDAFIEAALDRKSGEESLSDALWFLKDFQSKRCPTNLSIANIIHAWNMAKVPFGSFHTKVLCDLIQVLHRYPGTALVCVENGFLSSLRPVKTESHMGSLFMAALELDLFTKTLRDRNRYRKSLAYNMLSLDRNPLNIYEIVSLLGVYLRCKKTQEHTDVAGAEVTGDRNYPHTQERIYQLQRLLALALESSLLEQKIVVGQLSRHLCGLYRCLDNPEAKLLLLSSISSPLLTAAVAEKLLREAGYLAGTVGSLDTSGGSCYSLKFHSAAQFFRSYSERQQEEFAFLFYFTVWGKLESSAHRMEESKHSRLLNLGLTTPKLPADLHQCARHVLTLLYDDPTAEKPVLVPNIFRQFLQLTKCLLLSFP